MNKYILFYEFKSLAGQTLRSIDCETIEEAKQKAVEQIKSGKVNVRIAQEIPMTIEVKIQGGEEK
ncbi:hypothetical protein AM501_27400 [Aneurinibacillus migulanus]|uniref:hypothetical protein n=1 Tax=Aneurinibacillus migulanus TaxID=47500 RepID=UPI0005B9C581|nr:hypothetical protein [Aneurinibacillus migulanus]KIV56934.1 hypothetical protein TS64_07775 [Aneurinibacillus migulanus]KPD05286.1 hypothetical protein AM501_27400 [Aneurinibacillus migulanus]